MTVRIPDALAAFVDGRVDAHAAASRAEVVATALRHEQRRLATENDARIYAASAGQPDDLDGLAEYAAGVVMDDLA